MIDLDSKIARVERNLRRLHAVRACNLRVVRATFEQGPDLTGPFDAVVKTLKTGTALMSGA
jgi:hypothetical protein